MAQDFRSPSRSGSGRIVELCARCRDAEGGRKDKPGGLFVDRNRLSLPVLLDDLVAGGWLGTATAIGNRAASGDAAAMSASAWHRDHGLLLCTAELALEQAYRSGVKPVTAEIVEDRIPMALNAQEPMLNRRYSDVPGLGA